MNVLPVVIYGLCLVSCLVCTFLLLRGFLQSGTRLLLWAGICFAFLSLNNLAVLLDLIVLVEHDLQGWRHAASLIAITTLIVGLVWEAD